MGEAFLTRSTRLFASAWLCGKTQGPIQELAALLPAESYAEQLAAYQQLCTSALENYETLLPGCSYAGRATTPLWQEQVVFSVRLYLYALRGAVRFCTAREQFLDKDWQNCFCTLGRAADDFGAMAALLQPKTGFWAGFCSDTMLDGALTAAKDVVALLPGNNLSPAPVYDFTAPSVAVDTGASAMDVICAVADAGSVVELKGGYATHCVTALATVGGTTVGFVAFDGSAVCPACAYKAEAFVKLCDAYNLPILTVADADGFVKDAENAMLTAATRMETAYATATCPKIALITSKSIGGAYIALAGKGANADLTFAWDSAVLSPLDAEAAVAFLYSDRLAAGENRGSLVKEYKETLASPYTAAASGAIDDVIVPADSRAKVMAALDILAGKRENTLPRKHSVK